MRLARHRDAAFFKLGHGGRKILRLQTKMKTLQWAVGLVRQLQNGVGELQIGDLHAAGRFMLKIFFETEMLLVKLDRSCKIADMEGDVIDAAEHIESIVPRVGALQGSDEDAVARLAPSCP